MDEKQADDTIDEFYTNSIDVVVTLYDVTLTLADFRFEYGTLEPHDFAKVIMSPQLAYQLATILSDKLIRYELKYGAIPRPGALEKREDEAE